MGIQHVKNTQFTLPKALKKTAKIRDFSTKITVFTVHLFVGKNQELQSEHTVNQQNFQKF